MCTRNELENILRSFTSESRALFGDKLKDVILYGSYARGDYDDESDIDVLLLVEIAKDELHKYRRPIAQIANNADWEHVTLLSPVVKNYQEFLQYKEVMPFYKNVDREGVRLF